ncbi:hydrolase 1, exosortase A system-associated [Rugamonas apoptosis]|uniref:Hydrolase 1, exosortase A system-associated n=1 Tax=Rugamonas apoptosis TaxID=2758570 RepID=A0A7W2F928_9BURK|nr:hydrolase 1, exosortase A system-associated [Rugamonas apoptosis]MBA5687294.1 hydrolase 1, exosortase A system-associated [Rugamonas apoptosis]
MNAGPQVVRIPCGGDWLIGVLHLPPTPRPRGVLIVTGGPQYRVGSHRQFVLLARSLCAHNIPVLRFDFRGMGDSEGDPRTFEQVDEDVAAAIAHFFQTVPALRELVLWGLCDGATAAAFHACDDQRVRGLVMLNPWVRSARGEARATLRYYYLARLREAEFWRKLAAGTLGLVQVMRSLRQVVRLARGTGAGGPGDLPQRLYRALQAFRGQVLIILSGADLTGHEFAGLPRDHAHWRTLLAGPRIRQVTLPLANHTFARAAWRDEVAALCADWIASW